MEKFAFEFENDLNYSVIYDSEISPSMKISNEKVCMKVTSGGHVTFCGAKNVLDIQEIITWWYPIFVAHQAQLEIVPEKRIMDISHFETEIKNKKIKMEDLQQHFPTSLAKLLLGS